jgi:hypothetical protein
LYSIAPSLRSCRQVAGLWLRSNKNGNESAENSGASFVLADAPAKLGQFELEFLFMIL